MVNLSDADTLGSFKITVNTRVTRENYGRVRNNIADEVREGLEKMSGEMLQEASMGWQSGRPGKQTGAAAGSFYQLLPDEDVGSAHTAALENAKSLYVGNPIGGVGISYDEADFERIALHSPVIDSVDEDPSVIIAGIATPLKYVGWWNAGHFNRESGSVEFYPLMDKLRDKSRAKVVRLMRRAAKSAITKRNPRHISKYNFNKSKTSI